eukprot:SAG31_NODE_5582_length_2442_cov_6.075117_3_plen_128_part_00
MKAIFDKVDLDGSGSIDRRELTKLLGGVGYTAAAEDTVAVKIMAEMDMDGDGSISFEEFAHWWKQMKTEQYRRVQARGKSEWLFGGRGPHNSEGDVSHANEQLAALRTQVSTMQVALEKLASRLGPT